MATFETIDQLSEWLDETGVFISDLNITIALNESEECSIEKEESVTVLDESVFNVKSLVNRPTIALYENSDYDENTWFVDDFEFIEGACGTCEVKFNGSLLLMNVCEDRGTVRATLLCETDGELKNITFKLKKRCEQDVEYDMILSA
jgi:hypothetical protein